MQVPIYIYSLILHQTRNFTRKNRPCVRIRSVPNLEGELCFVESLFFFFFFSLLVSYRTLFSAGTIDGRVYVCVRTSVCMVYGNRKWTTAITTISVACWFATITVNCTLRFKMRYKSVT